MQPSDRTMVPAANRADKRPFWLDDVVSWVLQAREKGSPLLSWSERGCAPQRSTLELTKQHPGYYSVAFANLQRLIEQERLNMPENDFATSILETEVVVTHIGEGHVFHFPILSNGTVSLHGSRMEPNPQARLEARRYLFDAHNAARAALGRSFV
jgi:hypothetical protein